MKYAYFNPTSNPAPVLQWIDTDQGEWPRLPGSEYLIEASDAEWAARASQAWQVRDRRLEPVPSITLTQAQAAKLAELNAAYQESLRLPVSYLGSSFAADEWSQHTLTKVLTALTSPGAVPPGFFWVDTANNKVTMNFAQLQGLAGAMMSQGWSAFQKLQNLKSQARTATTVAAVQAITW